DAAAVAGKPLSTMEAKTDAIDEETAAKAAEMINEGLGWYAAHQDEEGGWSFGNGGQRPAITSLVAKAMVQHPDLTSETPIVAKAYELILSYQQDNGGIYDPKQGRQNYTTAIAVMAMAAADDPTFKAPMAKAVDYLLGLQIVPGSEGPEGHEIDKASPFIGGVSYGKHGRPDLSNVGFWVQALHEAGVEGENPAMQRALKFVTRTQNLSETNPLEFAREGTNDGGFIYAPARADQKTPESKAGQAAGGGFRSYGSMTYVGFKSLLYAGLGKDDPRVKAAYAWIRRYWRLDSNPNMPAKQSKEGLYYYYHAMAKALRAFGQDEIPALRGEEVHNWRAELIAKLAERQNKDGSWDNAEDRWGESDPSLTTAYCILALQETLKK
ncbi:MAG: hypothetical protein GVY16_04585, partial [Planctomycetes bacterium]|nr:hypothetical protein [Planctomycetota bacterium]